MRPHKINDETLLAGLKTVLTSKGYDGASLNDLASASGLQKASLYHRFPGGKKEIAEAVLNYVDHWINDNIVHVIGDTSLPPAERMNRALDKIDELYEEGRTNCILRALSLGSSLELFSAELHKTATNWVEAFAQLGRDFGMDSKTAKRMAISVLVEIQGSLVVGKMMNDEKIFKTSLKKIKSHYNTA